MVTPTGGRDGRSRAPRWTRSSRSGALTGGALHALEDAYTNLLNEAHRDVVPLAAERARPGAPRRGQRPARARRRPVRAPRAASSSTSRPPTGPPGAAGRDHDVVGDPRRPDQDRRRRHRPGPRLGHQRQRDGRPAERDHDRRHDVPRLLQRAPVRGSAPPRRARPARSTRSRSSSAASPIGGWPPPASRSTRR